MGGRGASSGGGGGLSGATEAQKDTIDRIKNNAARQGTFSDLKFNRGKNGTVTFTFTNKITNTKNNKGSIDAKGNVKYER